MTHPGLKVPADKGLGLHYIDQGTGVPVVFVHGDIQDYRTWKPQGNPFSQDDRFISYSRR